MPHKPHPPKPLRGAEPNTWAHSTITERLPEIVHRVIQENKFSAVIENALKTLYNEIPQSPIRFLKDTSAPDAEAWETYIAPHTAQNWLEVPWFFAEHYLYRRIIEAVRYFEIRQDPFIRQKQRGLEISLGAIESLAAKLNAWLGKGNVTKAQLEQMLTIDLWGNQADLSLWPADDKEKPHHANPKQAQQYVLADDREKASQYLTGLKRQKARVDFLMDNAGFELVTDLALADLLLSGKLTGTVKMHVKAHPTFVSDALASDVWGAVYTLKNGNHPEMRLLGERVYAHLMEKRLDLIPNFFWNSPRAFWDIPHPLRQELEKTNLLISKGDANYRRLLGDCHWPFTTPLAKILGHFSAPVLALRTLKAEVAAGISSPEVERAQKTDAHWMTNGRWGVVQLTN